MHPRDIMSNSQCHISATGDLIYFMSGSIVFRLGGLSSAISGSIKSRMTAGRHLGKLQQRRAVSLRQHCFLVLNYCFVLLDFIFVY